MAANEMTVDEFILIDSDGSALEFSSRAELALALLDMLLADGELHASAGSDGDGSLYVELM
jgi:hypothetical protein